MLMKAFLNVLQDDGFIVTNSDVDLGLLTARKEIDVEKSREVFWARVLVGQQATWNKNQIIEVNANISALGKITRARVNFRSKLLDNRGEVIKITRIQDEKYYQEFFAKIDSK